MEDTIWLVRPGSMKPADLEVSADSDVNLYTMIKVNLDIPEGSDRVIIRVGGISGSAKPVAGGHCMAVHCTFDEDKAQSLYIDASGTVVDKINAIMSHALSSGFCVGLGIGTASCAFHGEYNIEVPEGVSGDTTLYFCLAAVYPWYYRLTCKTPPYVFDTGWGDISVQVV
jgi:hypothetical protein